ncbi:glycosyltransferase [Candidatus Woesebacteria bacterium]|nr:glycosyltransferase [Candidatus Woesebacteria bacterium]
MKIALYSPYIPNHTGGGEKHLFSIALALHTKTGMPITVALRDTPAHRDATFQARIKKTYEMFLDQSLDCITWETTPLGTSANPLTKYLWTRRYSHLFYTTDGSIFFSGAKNSILHIQVPLTTVSHSLTQRLKYTTWSHINTNSLFTKQVVEREWGVRVDSVLHPVVSLKEFAPLAHQKKTNTIVSVGRFFTQLHAKRQDILIEMFINLCQKQPSIKKKWSLQLIGPVEDASYVAQLRRKAVGYPISFHHDVDRLELVKRLSRARLFWHAAGYGIKQSKHPEQVEHFGISTVEAMAAGAVPLVHAKGGQIEVLGPELKDLLWHTKEECSNKTLELIANPDLYTSFQASVRQRAWQFDQSLFEKRVAAVFGV